MSAWQRGIKYAALALAALLCLTILGGILQGLSFLPSLFGGEEKPAGEMKTYDIAEEIRSLDIDLSAAELTIRSGDRFEVESNLTSLSVVSQDGRVKIEEKSRWTTGKNRAQVTVTIPRNTVFDRAKLSTGAGLVHIEDLEAKDLDLDLGAGKVEISRLCATEHADIDGGVGSLTVSSGTLHDLDLDMGVGKLELTAKLTGQSKLDMGVGAAELTFIGQENYRILVDKGIGSINVAGNDLADGAVFGTGDTLVQVDGGVGSIRIRFLPEVSAT